MIVSYRPGILEDVVARLQARGYKYNAETPKLKRTRIEKTKKLAAAKQQSMASTCDPPKGPLPPGSVSSASRSSRPVEPTMKPKKLAPKRRLLASDGYH